jgi:hypothetical protein
MYTSAQKFLVSQFGLSAFTYHDGVYTAKTFNFNIYPRSFERFDKRFVCQASSLEFLTQHKFDFNKFIYEGIGYLSLQQAQNMREVCRMWPLRCALCPPPQCMRCLVRIASHHHCNQSHDGTQAANILQAVWVCRTLFVCAAPCLCAPLSVCVRVCRSSFVCVCVPHLACRVVGQVPVMRLACVTTPRARMHAICFQQSASKGRAAALSGSMSSCPLRQHSVSGSRPLMRRRGLPERGQPAGR